MNAADFEIFSRYWAGPVSNIVIVVSALLILYPVIWKISVHQLSAAIKALDAAKELPTTISQLTDASERLRQVNQELMELAPKLTSIEAINEQLEIANRRLLDLQKSNEERPLEIIIDVRDSIGNNQKEDEERWLIVSSLWIDVRDRIEIIVDSIVDGRSRRKYNSVPRHTYDVVVQFLLGDKLLTRLQATAVNNMDRVFRSLRNRRTIVTDEIVGDFQRWHDDAVRSAVVRG